ncbi:hypothetical protein TSUD_133330 [Trifolium subterraneum]|uniref:Uncharacterized protein n=1 Tax=Trifolium subterraneum TaxID=3900 RepID=A0A2Z6NBC0_TRISU|nr:hypothetical protein TSUD_133330 [Trifolium subterraneum]
MRRKVGSGETVRYWEENWFGNFNLCCEIEDLNGIVVDCNIGMKNWNWQWVRELNESEDIRKSELEELLSGVARHERAADVMSFVGSNMESRIFLFTAVLNFCVICKFVMMW